MFFMILMLSTLICISSNSWLGVWMGLEMNLLCFIPMMNNNKNLFSNESSLKYFLVQVFSSILLLFIVCMNFFYNNYLFMLLYNNMYMIILNSSLLMKLGMAPFHFWFPSVMESLDWYNNFILMTWQKINPFICLMYCMNIYLLYMISLISVIIGALGGMNFSSLRSILSYSSITHMGWMLISLMYNKMIFWFYFIIYMLISLMMTMIFNYYKFFYMNQIMSNSIYSLNKFIIMMMFFSMGGLPPFLGFFPKWFIIELLMNNDMFMYTIILVMMTMLTLFFYLRLMFFMMILNNFQFYWKNKLSNLKMNYLFSIFMILMFPLMFFIMI
uniref:NADH-ubiquinone oxidoreductase chain 2 n=1 Tax=Xenopsylla cheopis TaxID=163159 RepID=A0A8F5XTP5_XENCH|nr:NADH dehydrogenase subunit 2 [Xenopsylla cheopis]